MEAPARCGSGRVREGDGAQSQFHGLASGRRLDFCWRAGKSYRRRAGADATGSILSPFSVWLVGARLLPNKAVLASTGAAARVSFTHAELQVCSRLVGRHLCSIGAPGRGAAGGRRNHSKSTPSTRLVATTAGFRPTSLHQMQSICLPAFGRQACRSRDIWPLRLRVLTHRHRPQSARPFWARHLTHQYAAVDGK